MGEVNVTNEIFYEFTGNYPLSAGVDVITIDLPPSTPSRNNTQTNASSGLIVRWASTGILSVTKETKSDAGEHEGLWVAKRGKFGFITDDRSAINKGSDLGVKVADSIDIIARAVDCKFIPLSAGEDLFRHLSPQLTKRPTRIRTEVATRVLFKGGFTCYYIFYHLPLLLNQKLIIQPNGT